MLRADLNVQLELLAKPQYLGPAATFTQHEADALASLAYNGALFRNDELLTTLREGKDTRSVAEHFFDEVRTKEGKGGVDTGKPAKISLGLIQRRIGEVRMFLLGRYEEKSDFLRNLGETLKAEQLAKQRVPAVDRILALPSHQEVKR